ncbi:S41 family peptidase [Sporosarcina sp. FSL W8-0480]|uniref:S41 family peptidase n=1 Tax=Sporosarcina sp. FSL W8-0480 TaxID=2954701 RepID=UPI0030D7D776
METIFKEIIQIMHNDYAGCKDKEGWDRPEYFIRKIRENRRLSHKEFKQIVEEYLLDFNDNHIHFIMEDAEDEKQKSRGFKVRRYEDRLYVTEVETEDRLELGMSFVSIGGYSIPELKERHHRLLNENHAERENWASILMFYSEGEVEDENGTRTFTFGVFDKKPYVPTYSVEEREGVAFITITDFADPDAIVKLVEENKGFLEATDKWIIDVRVNYGGSDSSFYPFIPYLVPEEGVELAEPGNTMLFNCTEANANRILPELEAALTATDDEQAKWFLSVFKREWQQNRGKGFVEFDFGDMMSDTFVKGTKHPSSVIVLSDVFCGSSGDSFVEAAKKSSKVTVIGRATMGLNDYANLVTAKWAEGFELMYPSSRLSRIDKGEGMTGVGIVPHEYIPWTPEHIVEDIDVKKALELLSRNEIIAD